MNHATILVLLTAVLSIPSLAYIRNEDLRAQTDNQTYRVLPPSEKFAAAIEGLLFYRHRESSQGYYHSGYWIDGYTEINPWKGFALNGKLVFYNPAASYGVAATSYFHPFITVSWNDENLFLPLKLKSNFFYLDRQTLGAGLTLEEKEMSGFLLALSYDWARLKYIQDGTGGYNLRGDIHYLSFDIANDLLGVTVFDIQADLRPFVSIFSTHDIFSNLSYFAEVSRRNSRNAGLIGLKHQSDWTDYFSSKIKIQARRYEQGFAEQIKTQIEHDYLSIEQEDKSFTNSENIFVFGDDVNVGSIEAGFTLKLSKWLQLDTANEFYIFDYQSIPRQLGFFYRHSISIYPRERLSESVSLIVSNKMTNAIAPIYQNDARNVPTFLKRFYVGIEAKFAF